MYGLKRKVHFVGVGGIGMSGLAEILLNLGYEVSGSDLSASEITARLASYGLQFQEGHDAAHMGEAEILVISAAVPEDNPEVAAARAGGIPVIHRSDLLADLMRIKPHAVGVGGTHGKTTTTSMISAFLDLANIGATSIVGGILHRSGTNARWGTGDYLVAEADEHDGSFLRLHPTIAVVTNIDAEHLEYYGTIDRIQRAFTDFCNGVPFYGCAIVCHDDPNVQAILGDIEAVCLTYGLDDGAALQAVHVRLRGDAGAGDPLGMSFDVISHDERFQSTGPLGTIHLNVIGLNNVRNALAACAVGLSLGMRFGLIAEGLGAYDGVRRRLQLCGRHNDITVMEDYAHHPTEIASTLEAIRWTNPKRVLCVFQPHLYSRTKFFADDFAEVLATADHGIVTDIYPSREAPMPGVDAGLIVDAAVEGGARNIELVRDMQAVPEHLAPMLEAGDTVLILGAGDINTIAAPLLDAMRRA